MTLLGSLPQSYSTLVTALEACVDDIKLDFVQQVLMHEEQKSKGQYARSNGILCGGQEDSALMGRFKGCPDFRIRNAISVGSQDTFVEIVQKEGSRTMIKQCTKPGLQERNTRTQTERVLMKVCLQHQLVHLNCCRWADGS